MIVQRLEVGFILSRKILLKIGLNDLHEKRNLFNNFLCYII